MRERAKKKAFGINQNGYAKSLVTEIRLQSQAWVRQYVDFAFHTTPS